MNFTAKTDFDLVSFFGLLLLNEKSLNESSWKVLSSGHNFYISMKEKGSKLGMKKLAFFINLRSIAPDDVDFL